MLSRLRQFHPEGDLKSHDNKFHKHMYIYMLVLWLIISQKADQFFMCGNVERLFRSDAPDSSLFTLELAMRDSRVAFHYKSRLLNRQDEYISYHPWVVIVGRSIRFTICLRSDPFRFSFASTSINTDRP